MPPYPAEYFDRMAEKERHRKKRRLAKQNAKVMKNLGVRTEHFGKHWDWIADLRRAEKWGVGSFSQACYFFSQLQKNGLDPSLVKKKHLLKAINTSPPAAGDDSQRIWERKVGKKIQKLFQKLQKKKSRRVIVRREDRADEEPVNPADPPALIVGDDINRYDNVVVTQSFLGPFNLITGEVEALREDPGDSVHQLHLQFPDGNKYYPEFLVAPGAQVRANLEVPTMVFDIAAQIAQIPNSVPKQIKQTVIDAIKKTDLRRSPSMLACFDRIRVAALTDDKTVSVVDVLHGLAHSHWCVSDTGSYAFFYARLRSLKITDVVNYGFNWSNVRGQTVLNAQGEEMRINTRPPPPARKVSPHFRKKFEDTKEGQRLLGQKVFTYSGTDADGNYVYRTHYDTFIGTQRHIDQIMDQQKTILDARYAAEASATNNINTNAHANAGGDVSDDDGEPMDQ